MNKAEFQALVKSLGLSCSYNGQEKCFTVSGPDAAKKMKHLAFKNFNIIVK